MIKNNGNMQSPHRIVFLYRGGREKRFADAMRGACPTEFFYGAVELKTQGYDVIIKDVDYQTSSKNAGLIVQFLDLLFKYDCLPSRVYGPLLAKVWSLRYLLKNTDIVVATTPGIAFAVSILKLMKCISANIIAIQLGLTQHKFSKRKFILNKFFLNRMKSIVYLENELKHMVHKYDINRDLLISNQFGVDVDFWKSEEYPENGYIFALGSDGNRDYDLLIEASSFLNRKIVIVSNKLNKNNLNGNVEIISSDWMNNSLSDKDILALYNNASIVVVPLKNTTQPSGQSVTLQAMSCERPVVLSKTDGLWSSEILHDGKTVVLTTPGSLSELVQNLNNLLSSQERCMNIGKAARKAVIEYATIDHWTLGLLSMIRS